MARLPTGAFLLAASICLRLSFTCGSRLLAALVCLRLSFACGSRLLVEAGGKPTGVKGLQIFLKERQFVSIATFSGRSPQKDPQGL